jgi:hypothetical protein
MDTLAGLAVVLFAFAGIVFCLVFATDFEKLTGYPRRRPFYFFLIILLVAVIGLLALYEFGLIRLAPGL